MEFLYNSIFYVLSCTAIIFVIVFVHELGHYLIAKYSGVRIEEFSIGFGPEIFGWNDKSTTRWKICWIPLGGYVKMFGDTDPASTPDSENIKNFTKEEQKLAFHTKPLGIKAAVVFGGPLANYIFAILVLTFLFAVYGRPVTLPVASEVSKESAAYEAGIIEGDIIVEIDGTKIELFNDIQRAIAINVGTPITILLNRNGEEISVTATPKITESTDSFGNKAQRALLGISSQVSRFEELPLGKAFIAGVQKTYHVSVDSLKVLGQIITGQRSATQLTGIIGIAKYSGQAAERGFPTALGFVALLSISLGLINLFPIPVLDGGHLLYYLVEAVSGKALSDKIQIFGMKIGGAFVILLVLFTVVNDIKKLILG